MQEVKGFTSSPEDTFTFKCQGHSYAERTVFIRCNCRCKGIELSQHVWSDGTVDDDIIMTTFVVANGDTFWNTVVEKAKAIWNVFRFGKHFQSDIILNRHDAERLYKYLGIYLAEEVKK